MADDRSASMLELKAIDAPTGHYDVAILGGGLAGLTLAIQLKRERPETRVLVTDKRTEPAPEAAFKVGESSVEIGAYYYREMIGMRDHLEKYQQRKLGLRFFLPAGDNSDITKRVEFCTPGHLDAFTHQIDRGRFENELFRRARKAGADAFRGWRVQDVSLGADTHTILMSQEDEECIATARWVVDASGRANILRRKLGLGEGVDTGHHCNAAWIRLAGGMDFEDWTDDEEWLGRMPEKGLRIHSTSHLIQPGYWLWLIQLESGPISIGVCADPRFHPWEEINELRRLHGLDEAQRAAAARGARGTPRGRARLPARPGLLVRVHAVLLVRPVDAGRRGGRLPRRAVFAGIGLHRVREHVQRRADRARPRRRGRDRSSSISTTTST